MHRRASPELITWFEQRGTRDTTEPLKTPADEKFGLLERWCVPVRYRGIRLGELSLINTPKIAEIGLGVAVDAAEQLAILLHRRRLAFQVDTDLLRLLVIPTPDSQDVASEVRQLGSYTHVGPVAVVVTGTAGNEPADAALLSDMAHAVREAAAQAPDNGQLAGLVSDLGVLLAPLRSTTDLSPAHRMAENVRRLATHVSRGVDFVAAVGDPVELENASRSWVEARRALRVVRAVPDLGPTAFWGDLGIFRALTLLPMHDAQNSALDPRVRELLADSGLVTTAEVFLDLACDVQATAAKLYLHRTTLYQRLNRIATLYGLDLRHSGDHRLITHFGLKLARMRAP